MNLWEMFVEWCGKRIADNWDKAAEILTKIGNAIEPIINSIIELIQK